MPSEDVGKTVVALPELPPKFFIPHLDDKPQNPIMDTLRILQKKPHTPFTSSPPAPSLPPELVLLSEDLLNLEDIWQSAALRRHGHMSHVLSWDALRPSFNANADPSPFLSEQSTNSFASARYHLRPPIRDPDVHLVYTQAPELFQSLLLTVSGTSSHLHIWSSSFQRFVLRGLQEKQRGHIVIVGKDEIVSASLLKRFLTIGNLMRRLEILTETRSSSRHHSTNQPTPTLHAFTHALSSILAFLRETAEAIPPDMQASLGADARLTALWTKYEDMEGVLQALAALCGREDMVDPVDFNPIPTAPNALLSAIYHHLTDHFERSSPQVVTATLAFMLSTTSRGFMESLCASVGYSTPRSQTRPAFARSRVRSDDRLPSAFPDDENEYGTERPEDDLELDTDGFPEFILPEVAEVFTRSRKSLVLLRAADPEHPLLTSKRLHPEIEWLWTEEQLDNMDDVLSFGTDPLLAQPRHVNESGSISDLTSRADILNAFKVFDLLPGEPGPNPSTHSTANLLSTAQSTATLRAFLAAFPLSLPPSTPTLSHLTARVLAPLICHAQALSGALVARFLSPSTHLHLHTHLVLLRGYILVTSHAFKSRLQDALFSDAEDVGAPVVASRMYATGEARDLAREERAKLRGDGPRRSRSRAASGTGASGGEPKQKQKKGKRIVGLSPALTIGDKWPPLGSDLNFLLRTVVVDALEDGRAFRAAEGDDGVEDEKAKTQRRIVEEAGWRLGFAIRDLPMGTGREKWLNPFAIEALDFLYMHYQPPYPLDVLITPAVLSKYHRMFAFNLRLVRIENVVRTLFRLTRSASAPLFPTLTPSNKLLLHFRFVVHAFVMAVSSYVYDVAIGSNMDTLLARLATAAEAELSSSTASTASSNDSREPAAEAFADVFSLGEHHSRVLDDVLSSCLLRSGQKAVGDILRQCMECVLELGVLAGELRDGNLEEYEAAPLLEALWGRFRAKMTTFVKVLKALVEKEADGAGLVLSDIPLHMIQGARRVSGTTANLHQLLLRLNMSEWWTRKENPKASS